VLAEALEEAKRHAKNSIMQKILMLFSQMVGSLRSSPF